MSTDSINVELQERTVIGKGLATLRREGQIPAVIHNHGSESIHVMGDTVGLAKVFAAAGKHTPVDLTVSGKKYLAMIKDADFEPVKHQLRHIVFQAIRQNETTTAEIPVVLVGDEIPAEKKSLLVLTQLDHVEVEALPRDLPEQLTVDASKLEDVGDNLTVADLVAPKGVEILTDPTSQIAIVEMPRDQIAEADAALAEQAAAEGADEEAEGESAEASAEGSEAAEEKPAE